SRSWSWSCGGLTRARSAHGRLRQAVGTITGRLGMGRCRVRWRIRAVTTPQTREPIAKAARPLIRPQRRTGLWPEPMLADPQVLLHQTQRPRWVAMHGLGVVAATVSLREVAR